ncbi:F-actin-monooxygenase Mical isoform X9 [Teleopsis dalmanni]|uniref:F-actin-monooxygenase Mical isoform X9 n=1 Tax=Teleopsis dalmanni TaxID=139649 RepID=UPI0018CF637D|nr:F-actin-monooxygenase Mical isoform X9 [Teleopsis dalmanni]
MYIVLMSRQRQQQKLQQQQLLVQQQQMADNEAAAAAAEMFDLFCMATTMRQILGLHRNMCDVINIRPSVINEFYPKLKQKIRSWKAQALWKKFDARAAHRVYAKGNACSGTRVLVIGAGPCGLRTAIEAQLLGAKVVVVEKRDRISRNNVLHLWPFVITDLRNLGAKKFYGKFCAGSIDHISIRQLQCILLKVALLLGVEIHEGVSFERTIEPSGDGCGWRAVVTPADHAVSHYEFDVLIGADGKRNTLEGFKRKEFRGKLAIAITANFINKKTEAEAKAEEISGVAFIFNQSFFKELYEKTYIDLENIVYYKDETHYFVMTAKKHSLIDKGVIIQDFADPAELLAINNVNSEKLLDYAREAAEFSTKYQMTNLEFAVNHYGKPDVAMFDFTSMFAAETSCKVIVRKGFRLLQCLVGDSLLEPFWPTGSGCARGFLSSMDAAYAIKLWSNSHNSTLGVLAQRESIYRLLNQTTPENLQRDTGSYTVDPATRYPNLNRTSVNVWQVKHLIDTDDPSILEQTFMDTNALQPTQVDSPVRRKRRSGDTLPFGTVLLCWISAQLHKHDFVNSLKQVSDVFTNGKVLCALINRYRPDLIDFNAVKDLSPVECNEIAFQILDRELHIPRIMSGEESVQLNATQSKVWLNYLEQIYDVFRGEIPHVKHPKMDFPELREKYRVHHGRAEPDFSNLLQISSKQKTKLIDAQNVGQKRSILDEERLKRLRKHELNADGENVELAAAGSVQQAHTDTPRRAKKRRSAEKATNISSKVALAFKKQAAAEKCHFCKQIVYLMEKVTAEGLILHRSCLKCHHCHTNLRLNAYAFDRDDPNGRFYCTQHFRLPAKAIRPMVRKPGQRKPTQQQQAAAAAATTVIEVASNANLDRKPVDKLRSHTDNVAQIDLLDRGQTPERIEFENTDAMSDGEPSEEHIIDEHEWSGRNFLPESNNDSESDLSSSDESDTESDSDMFEEANDSPLGAQTLQLATDWIGKQNYTDSDDVEFDYSSDGLPDNDDTEGEEFKKARELRREEVRLLPLPANLPTDTETEVQTESDTTSPNEAELNSATEISTDSEFENDEVIREAPKILIDDTHIKKPTKVKIKSAVITTSTSNKHNIREGSYLAKYQTQHQPPQPQFKPLVQVDPTLLNSNRAPLQNPRPGDYLLNKTASTEGIASKKSLELKKRYLLGEAVSGNKIQKSGSTSVLDSKIRSFQSNISECQKLLNPSSDVSPSMKTFLDRTKLGENNKNEILRSATSNILNELRVAITIQKASSTTSTDNEKENVYVNSKNELNKGMEYSESINSTLLESISKKTPTTPTVNTQTIIETIDLVTPEKEIKAIIDLTAIESPKKINKELADIKSVSQNGNIIPVLTATDTNKIIDLTVSSPEKCDNIIIADAKPDISKDVKEHIPDLLGHIEHEVNADKQFKRISNAIAEDQQNLLNNSDDEEKRDSPEKQEEHYENDTLQIEVPTIPWHTRKNLLSSTTASSCTSNSSSLEDIQHYILESTTSPDTQTGSHQVPRVEIHDVTGTLMQTDNLMLADNKYEDDSLNCKYTNNSESIIVPEIPAVKTTVVEDDAELDVEPVTATPEPAECTIIEAKEQAPPLPEQGPPLPEKGPPKIKPANLKFDTKNENKVESLKNLPLVVEQFAEHTKVIKPLTLNLSKSQKTPTTPTANLCTPTSPLIDNDKTPTADLLSKGSDSETEPTGTGHALTETELSDWTADDCISENFIDMEFVLNSNKGTIKRNKKGKRKSNTTKLPTTSEVMFEVAKTAPVAEFEGILKSIDIDDIEFMDTGSESSCAEAYSATNTALLRNRGYIEFIETTPQQTPSHKLNSYSQQLSSDKYGAITTKRDEKLGIDYIEQGAYIMQTEDNSQDMLKTPVNEHPSQQIATILNDKALTQSVSIMTQSLTDSSTLNDLDDDSLCIVTPNSQAQLSSVTAKTTTEESDALTVVTSPIDSSSPKMHEPTAAQRIAGKSPETGGGSTPSSSEKQPKTSQSTCTPSSTSNTMSSKPTPSRQSSQENSALVHSNGSAAGVKNAQSKLSDELSYEYVRALQQKITQISTARDSLESRKQRRKSSKGEAPVLAISKNSQQTVIEPTPPNRLQQNLDDSQTTTMTTPAIGTTHVNRVPEIPTLTRKLEEITKERTKQKDLIHDLVMDKLQSKKQLNAEKRLHRSRQRNMLTSGYGSGSSLSPTPKIEAAKSTDDNNCTNKAHYHVSTAASNADNRTNSQRILTATSTAFKENTPIQTSATYVSAYNTGGIMTTNRSNAYKQRPISEHIHGEKLDALERYKLNKTPSFTYSSSNNKHNTTELPTAEDIKYPIPIAPVRQNRGRNAAVTTPTVENPLTTSTENLRSEARARARLKSNTELGLSPEEKMQLLRKRLQVEHLNVKQNSVTAVTDSVSNSTDSKTGNQMHTKPKANVEHDLSARDRKMSTSKSVNDLVFIANHQQNARTEDHLTATVANSADFTSDPNILLSSTSAQANTKTKSSRRPKDPERRKSLIQSLSSFFHKSSSSSSSHNNKDKKEQNNTTASATNSAPAERPNTSGSSTTASGSTDGMFSRFRISPKSKEKSRSFSDVRILGFGDKDGFIRNTVPTTTSLSTRTTPTKTIATKLPHERSNSQECIHHKATTYTRNNHSHQNSNSNNNINNKHNKKLSPSATFSSSSPQLYFANNKLNCASSIHQNAEDQIPPPIPPLPLHYQRSDDESYATETREHKKQRAISKAVRQAELKRLRIAQEIQREQEEIEVQLKELEARGVLIEKALRGEEQQNLENLEASNNIGNSDEKLLKELLEIWRNVTQLKRRDEELGIRQQELQLEHRHAQLKEELNSRLSNCSEYYKLQI